MAYNDEILNPDDRAKVQALGEQWTAYQKAGDTAGMQNAHAQAEAIRSRYGYSGGADGSGYTATGVNTVLRSAQPLDERINDVYDKQLAADKAALEAAQNQKMLEYDHAEQQIAPTYDKQRGDYTVQHEIGTRNMAERFNALGLGNGAQGQMYLSENNNYLRNMGNLNAQEAKARADLEFERTKARTAYQDAVAQAIRDGDAARAKALYQEAQRVDASLVSTSANQMTMDLQREATEWNRKAEQAENLAKFGDFSGYQALGYSDAEIANMRRVWEAQNPELVAMLSGGYYGGGSSGGGGGSRTGGPGTKQPETKDGEVRSGTKKGTAQYIGTQGQKDKSSLIYSPDEGVFTWNGKNYTNVASLKAALNKTALSDAEAAAIERKFHASTGGTLGLS